MVPWSHSHLICKNTLLHGCPHPSGQAQARIWRLWLLPANSSGFTVYSSSGATSTTSPSKPGCSSPCSGHDLCGRAGHHAAPGGESGMPCFHQSLVCLHRKGPFQPPQPGAPFCLSCRVWGAWSVAMASTSSANMARIESASTSAATARWAGFHRNSCGRTRYGGASLQM